MHGIIFLFIFGGYEHTEMMAYSQEQIDQTFELIINRIAEKGESLRSVLRTDGMPSSQTFFIWIQRDEVKSKQYAQACEKRADEIFEEILTIADDSSQDTIITEEGKEIFNNEFAARSRLRVDARKWVVARMNPRKYGDKNTTILEGGEKPIQTIDYSKLSDGALKEIVNASRSK